MLEYILCKLIVCGVYADEVGPWWVVRMRRLLASEKYLLHDGHNAEEKVYGWRVYG
jgi:hypothetical protein